MTAATWLEQFGKKDIWKLYAHDQAEWCRAADGDRARGRLGPARPVQESPTRSARSSSSPRRTSSSPRCAATTPVNAGQVCPCSYPSRHAGAAAAARAYLAHFMPHRLADYRWMEDEIDYSRIYMAGHVPSDITRGALLGDMIGEYFLVTRDGRGARLSLTAPPGR